MTVVIRERRRGHSIGCISKPTQNMPPLVVTRETERNVLSRDRGRETWGVIDLTLPDEE